MAICQGTFTGGSGEVAYRYLLGPQKQGKHGQIVEEEVFRPAEVYGSGVAGAGAEHAAQACIRTVDRRGFMLTTLYGGLGRTATRQLPS